jgi:hypothetical protein
MENKGLLFIPDISGFSKFVHESEIEHSRLIIQDLLEVLINSNHAGLEISEIEGDAILFYKYGAPPSLQEIYKQVEKMFVEFHKHLLSYEYRRLCQCKACITAINLTLKVITHYGEFTGYNVKNFNKLIGKDVIVAHQLLKNDIAQHEYWLVTDNLLPDKKPLHLADWMEWGDRVQQTDTGQIAYHFTQLGELKNRIKPEPPPQLELAEKVKVVSVSKEYDTDVKSLFYTALHFEFRHLWLEGVKGIDQVDHLIPGIGTKHRCLLDKGFVIMYSSTFSYDPDTKIEYSETDEKKKHATYFTLEKLDANKSRLTVDLYIRKNLLMQTMFSLLMKRKMEASFTRSLEKLAPLLNEIRPPVEF